MAKNKATETMAQDAPAPQETRGSEVPPGQDKDVYLLMEAPITEMAEAFNMDIDDAVRVRVNAHVEAATQVEVNVRPIEPRGKLIGVAEVKMNGIAVDDFKVFNGDKGLFLGPPSKPDSTTRSGFRRTARVTDDALQSKLDVLAYNSYNAAVEKLMARAEAVRSVEKPSIREQLRDGVEKAAQENASRPMPERAAKEAHNDR